MSLFNFGFLNWIVVMCIVFLTYIRWNNTSDLNTSYLNIYYFGSALLFFIWVLNAFMVLIG
jgi:hypothetical protein